MTTFNAMQRGALVLGAFALLRFALSPPNASTPTSTPISSGSARPCCLRRLLARHPRQK